MPEAKGKEAPRRVAVAMSGGVDSSVAALLLAEAGHSVTGVTLKLFCAGEKEGRENETSCCSAGAIDDAARVASRIGIAHHVWDFTEPFRREVIEPFRRAYRSGRTPNPCVECNRKVRFRLLLDKVRAAGCDALATGHYARLFSRRGEVRLARGCDRAKDQSYVLWGIAAADLPLLLFPLGDLEKVEVRRIAARARLSVADRKESQDICFLPGRGLASFLGRGEEGPIVSAEGREIGRHRGVARFTIGQRKGLGVAAAEPLYVTGIDPARNIVRLGREEELYARTLVAAEMNLLASREELFALPVEAQIRYRHRAAPARVRDAACGTVRVDFDEPQRAITPGQSIVFYRADRVLGGAVITSTGPS